MNSRTTDYEHVNCYLCGGSESTLWARENGFNAVRCQRCGLVYVNPRPGLRAVSEAARTGMHEGLNTIGLYSKKKVARYSRRLSELFPDGVVGRQPCRWLDVGAGFGELVEALSNLCPPGSELLGIEPCEPKVRRARARGRPVKNIPLSALKGPYTHISLINIFSHLPNPVHFISELRSLMARQGQLVLVTGNGGDVLREDIPGSLYLPDHLSFIGAENLKMVFDQAGFDVLQFNQYRQEPEGYMTGIPKNIARKLLGRPTFPLSISKDLAFRNMWVLAERRDRT